MLIPLATLKDKYQLDVRGVFHVGAHEGEEEKDYFEAGAQRITWVEANPQLAQKLQERTQQDKRQTVITALVSDEPSAEPQEFHISNNGQSSSMLPLGTHKKHHPQVEYVDTLLLPVKTIMQIFQEYHLKPREYNFLNMDIQGNELRALKGMGTSILSHFRYVYLEVNTEAVYEGCGLLHEIEDFMTRCGFERKEVKILEFGWGDGFWMRKDPPLSLILTSFNYSWCIQDALREAVKNPMIREIVIVDDNSDDAEQLVRKVKEAKSDKIRLIHSTRSRKAFHNKLYALKQSSTEWAILLDADNYFHKGFLDTLVAQYPWNPRVIYCPSKALKVTDGKPDGALDYTPFIGDWDLEAVKSKYSPENQMFDCLLNTGNYMVHVPTFIKQFAQSDLSKPSHVLSYDVLYANYFWLKAGGKLQVVPGLEYFHRVGHGSNYIRNHGKAEHIKRFIVSQLDS